MDHVSVNSNSTTSSKRSRGRPPVLSLEEQSLSPSEKQKIYYRRYRDNKRSKVSKQLEIQQWSNSELEHINILRSLGDID